VRERGYSGGEDHFRHLIAHHRPRPQPEAYLRLRTLPGEQGQTDWGHFGKLTIGKAERTLMAFVMVLSFSRQPFLRFFLDARRQPISCAATRRPSPPGVDCPGSCSTTT
jgi:transposase